MSIDTKPDSPYHDNDQQPPKPKSKLKFWLFGGCGCLTFMLLICCIGPNVYYYQIQNSFKNEQIGLAENSEKVAELIGEDPTVDKSSEVQVPVKLEGEGDPDLINDALSQNLGFEYRYNIEGTNGKGILRIISKPTSNGFGVELHKVLLEVDDMSYNLDPDAELEDLMEIEEGFDEGFEDGDQNTEDGKKDAE